MLELSTKTNLLEENNYRYSLQDVKDPVLYRDVYNYEEIPKVAFNHRRVPISMPEDIWITDTSFRDGQQAFHPYTPEQIESALKEKGDPSLTELTPLYESVRYGKKNSED